MASDAPLAPDFIRFLFSTKPKFDCYFQVGNKSQGKPERIGAVKLMLMAHSEVFRLELEDSDLKEKNDVPVKDIHPDTFKGMLKYVYGHDTTSDLCFEDADNLLYVAEKYMIKTLKDKLAVRLMKLLSPDNICSLLNNPACYTHLELNSAITEILRFETDHVLASPQFLWMNPDGFLKILEQDGLAVPEIELWRAAIKWAKQRANSEDGQLVRQQLSGLTQHLRLCSLNEVEICREVATTDVLTSDEIAAVSNSEDGQLVRQQLSGLTQHLRLCTLTADEICTEVVTTGVLSNDEIGAICLSIGKKEKPRVLSEISNKVKPRNIQQRIEVVEVTKLNQSSTTIKCEHKWTLITKKNNIKLLPFVCQARDRASTDSEDSTYKVDCTTTIIKVVSPDNSSANEPPITVSFSENVKCGMEFEIPLAVDGRDITLLPDTKYTVKMKLNGKHKYYYSNDTGSGSYGNDQLTLDITLSSNGYYLFPSTKLQYRATTVSSC